MSEHTTLNVIHPSLIEVASTPAGPGQIAARWLAPVRYSALRLAGWLLFVGGLAFAWLWAHGYRGPGGPSTAALLTTSTRPTGRAPGFPIGDLLTFAICAFLPAVWWTRRRRRGVLYLRRFGHTAGTAMLSRAAAATGRRWRFVTLDDNAVAARGPRVPLRTPANAVTGLGERLAVWSMRGQQLSELLATRLRLGRYVFYALIAAALVAVVGESPLAPVLTRVAFAATLVVLAVAMTISLLPLIPLALYIAILPATLTSTALSAMIAEADSGQRVRIDRIEQLPDEVAELRLRNRRLFAPRLGIVQVQSAIWPQAVLAIAGVCHVAVFDVSQPIPSIAWEIDTVGRFSRATCVFVGDCARLRALNRRTVGDAPVADEVVRLVAGRPVLGYHDAGADLAGFVRRLRLALAGVDQARSGPAATLRRVVVWLQLDVQAHRGRGVAHLAAGTLAVLVELPLAVLATLTLRNTRLWPGYEQWSARLHLRNRRREQTRQEEHARRLARYQQRKQHGRQDERGGRTADGSRCGNQIDS
ncbi:hypothetical protein [Frankia sp. R82]|uniref:hypothetical protein n=1 Tax=Frankia sp. R82 TaxID=2950553 RepID=UPI002043FD94|nr:hypothetical protein [Frankia sp. R82]MCM3886532.1 hypothetical protein [Frankia sp. R82]